MVMKNTLNMNIRKLNMITPKLLTSLARLIIVPKSHVSSVQIKADISYSSSNKSHLYRYDSYIPNHIYCRQASTKKKNMKTALYMINPFKKGHISLNPKIKTPTIFYIHGGSWTSGDKALFFNFCESICHSGYNVFAINYRLLPDIQISICVKNCLSAIKHILGKYSFIDEDNIVIMGDSAGAHISSTLCARINNNQYKSIDIKIKGCGLFYGVFDLNMLKNQKFLRLDKTYEFIKLSSKHPDKFIHDYSPINMVSSRFPNTFIACGQVDPLYPQTEKFIGLLHHYEVPVKSLIFDKDRLDANHAYINIPTNLSTKETIQKLRRFLNNLTDKKDNA